MRRYRPLLLPFVMSLIGLAVLVSLGKWQLDRREWKLALIERIDARVHGAPISLAAAREHWERDGDVEYYRVRLNGRLLSNHERHLYGVVDGKSGWHIITPLETANGTIIFVNLGIVPEDLKDPSKRVAFEKPVTLMGLIRRPAAQGLFTPDNQPAANRWFWRDVDGMTASLPENLRPKVLPFMADAQQMVMAPQFWARGGVTRLELPNRHLEYAITWFGLAAALIVIFVLYARRRLSETSRPGRDGSIADEGGNV